MATPVIMPRQGQSVESCIISKWHKKKGEKVNAGDILFTYETDKATFDEEAKVEGVLLDIFFEEGDDVPCLLNVCAVGQEGESAAEFNPNAGSAPKAEEAPQQVETPSAEAPQEVGAAAPAAVIDAEGKLKISPRARSLADKAGVDSRYANASGPYGRIIEKDIQDLISNGPKATFSAKAEFTNLGQPIAGTGLGGRVTTGDLHAPVPVPAAQTAPVAAQPAAEVEEVKLSNIRKVIAKAMHNSLASTAQLTLHASFDATDIMEYRKKLKENKERLGLENITLNDIILYAVSRTILNHKDLNANFLEDRMLYFKNVHLGLAVDTERGLMVPNIFHVNLKSLNEISREAKALAQECQKGTISPDKLKGGSFTITNLGTLDVEYFTPVLNAPQTGILGVGCIVQRVKEVDGDLVTYPAMTLSLTFDHKALDGAPAAKFLKELKTNLENFSLLLAK